MTAKVIAICAICLTIVCYRVDGNECDEGWTSFDDNLSVCYLFAYNQKSWIEAKETCDALHSKLGKIDTRDKVQYVLTSPMITGGCNAFWVAPPDRQGMNGFNAHPSDCIVLTNHPATPNTHWDFEYCFTRHCFICEKRIV
ncbi:uncharacterized protein LOC130052015 [Ostrea edulis]|uniref:uncharacterized protein LOC130052014 n=1 Tax=Ostrea edulis TaxID=37623 RepID=UPI0024AFE100|nr:uncharacterized protein LOC130052014 [Ostrea edulis]XP_056011697.1 uncharacterized protein LOC130052014 [Ostrea edulis]XP_056011698.1 uncharacterized protein LOC130052014 [Ostrea edulis]XP_056011699.1 uncharacterized protein LOC130052014 [Ostrea edulis]XP_056011700.1 uncharacterized protein LOC130052015 [Ostrea edulis]XP_056011701.1 uncharacterized protein LOC130052015 [Ostrea edulis]XP_056011702.1 uncharacterized protein LOC130052015 [Ostrea edulis]XP_056011703.1 uncharacterized protein 